jgi:hypothetical protein
MEAELENLNCLDVGLDTPIYRITATEFLLKDRRDDCLTLTRIDRAQWFDPTENGLLIAQYKTEQDEDLSLAGLTKHCFGSCWSLRPLGTEEDWEAFAHEKPGIRIQSTPRKILGGLVEGTRDPHSKLKYWMGKVIYLTDDERHAFFDDPDWIRHLDFTNRRIIETVLRVRSRWKGENEIRLVVDRMTDSTEDPYSKLVPIEKGAPRVAVRFEWTDVVTGLLPGPTLKDSDLAALRDAFPIPPSEDGGLTG